MSQFCPPFFRPILLGSLALLLNACGGGGGESASQDTSMGRSESFSQSGFSPDPTCGIAGFADEMLSAVNQVRAQGYQCGAEWEPPAPPLGWNAALEATAAAHSLDMATHNFVSHTGSDGGNVASRAATHGYPGGVGENLGGGQKNVAHLMEQLLASPAHCANLMRPDYRTFGAACVSNDATLYKRHWTQVFGQ